MCDKYYAVSETVNKLQDFVRRMVDEKNLNYREVARRSRGLISHSTVYDIINGRNTNPSITALQGLARGLGVTEEEVFAIARGKEPDEDAVINEGLYRNYQKLSPQNRRLAKLQIAAIIDALAANEPDIDYISDE
jgi:transcriptional regulator with XRE-family HTH domain